MAEPLVIACASDDNFAMPMAVMLFSALSRLPRSAVVSLYVFDNGITDQSKDALQRVLETSGVSVEWHWVRPDVKAFEGLRTKHWINASTYVRLAVADYLPTDCHKVLYLDGDMVILRDLSLLWNEPIEQSVLLAVRDFGIPSVSSPQGLPETFLHPHVPLDAPYFNAGVMAINLVKWRQDDIQRRALSYLNEYQDKIQFADQEGLNAVLAGAWHAADASWNVQTGALRDYKNWPASAYKSEMLSRQAELLRSPGIVHFTGSRKPWAGGMTDPFRHFFVDALRACGWFSDRQYRRWSARWLAGSLGFIGRRLLASVKPE